MSMSGLKYNESIYSQFIEQVKGYAIFAMDTEGNITSWNVGAERMKGYKEDEVIGKHLSMLFPDEAVAEGKPEREIKQALKDGHFENEDWRKKKDGSLFWAKVVLTPIYNEEKKLIGFTKVTNDLTEKRKAEEALTKKNEQLQRINSDLDNFVYTASHDLKAPIANIEGLTQLLISKLKKKNIADTELNDITGLIIHSIVRFKSTIKDMAEITKVQKNIYDVAEEGINIDQIFQDVKADIICTFKEICHKLTTDFQVLTLQFSAKNFRSILYNLLSNAFKYTSPLRECEIHIKTEMQTEHVLLSVKDNGLGIREENKSSLFTLFKRFHDHTEGTGIGLYIIKRIIDNVGGKIEVESTEGAGSEFKVYFPVNKHLF